MKPILAVMTNAPPEVAARTVASALPFVDGALFVVAPNDKHLVPPTELPHRVVEIPWRGHALTRTLTLRAAEKDAGNDWILMLDAGMTVRGELPIFEAFVDAYDVVVEDVASRWRWHRPGHLMRAHRGFHWKGTGTTNLHEVFACDESRKIERWSKLVVAGAPSAKANGSARTYERDAANLALSLSKNPRCTRTAFYFASSLLDAGHLEAALAAFLRRAEMGGGFTEETFWAWLRAGDIASRLGRSQIEITRCFAEAGLLFPNRAEPLTWLAATLRARGDVEAALELAKVAMLKPWPSDALLFIDTNSYSPDSQRIAGLV